MKKSLLSKIAVMLMLVMSLVIFTACGGSGADYLPVYKEKTVTLDNSAKITLGTNEEINGTVSGENVIKIKKTVTGTPDVITYALYDLEAKKVVGKYYASIGTFSNGIAIVYNVENNVNKYGLINIKGEELKSLTYKSGEIDILDGGRLVLVGNEYYKVESDKTLATEPIADSTNLDFGIADNSNLHIYGDYLYAGSLSTSGTTSLNAYTLKGELIKEFLGETGVKYFIMHDGNVLKMKSYTIPADSKNYTYFSGITKYSVNYEVYSLKKKSFSTIKYDKYIMSISCCDNLLDKEKELYTEKSLKLNGIVAYEIKDKLLVQTNDYAKHYLGDNSLKEKYDLGLFDITAIAEDRYLYRSVSNDNSYIKDTKGKIITTIGKNFSISVNEGILKLENTATNKFGAIDSDGNIIVSCKYNALGSFYGGYAIALLENADGTSKYYSISKSGTETEIKDYIAYSAGNFPNYIIYPNTLYQKSTLATYDLYNAKGTKLISAFDSIISVNAMKDGYIFRTWESGQSAYYYIY